MANKKKEKVTPKESKFCFEYVKTGNGKQSAIKAGYQVKSSATTACLLLQKEKIQNKIEDIRNNVMESAGISALAVALELKNIAFSNVSNYFDTWMKVKDFEKLTHEQKAGLADIRVTQKKFNGITEDIIQFKLHDKLKALEMISKMFGLNEPEKIQQEIEFTDIPVIKWIDNE